MKLWSKEGNISEVIEAFTIGDDPLYDMVLAPFDVIGSIAHVRMLHRIGYLTGEEHAALIQELENISEEIEKGDFRISEGVEDVHSQVEFILTERLGETGKKLHVGRSRNDQIALDLRLYYRDVLHDIKKKVVSLVDQFLEKAQSCAELMMPGYTHSQSGMVSSFGLWYASFAESLIDDIRLINTTIYTIDQNPLGSAAGYGSSLPNDRHFTTQNLGFNELLVNSIYAQNSRGKSELFLSFLFNSLAVTINRFASDVCIFSNENYRFLSLPDELTTGSSIMPHKRNPDVMELIRAKCNQLSTIPSALNMLLANLQTGYHRDYQLLKEIIFPALNKISQIVDILLYCIPRITENKNIMDDPRYKYCFTVESINELVNQGISFREAYHQVKASVKDKNFDPEIAFPRHTHIGSIGNLGIDEIRKKMQNLI